MCVRGDGGTGREGSKGFLVGELELAEEGGKAGYDSGGGQRDGNDGEYEEREEEKEGGPPNL